jgi:hypothetical protein
METDHIIPEGDGGQNNIENAIPLCFDCHAEVHSYNDNHPRGRKYTTDELRLHKVNWIEVCEKNPNLIHDNINPKDSVLLSLINELEFNKFIITYSQYVSIPLETKQFHAILNSGMLFFIDTNIKESIFITYSTIMETNRLYEIMNKGIIEKSLQIIKSKEKLDHNQAMDIASKAIDGTLKLIDDKMLIND